MTKDEILGRFMLIVSQTLIYSGHNLISQREREELADLIGAWEALQWRGEKELEDKVDALKEKAE